jgi:prolyl 4-hydroxylase
MDNPYKYDNYNLMFFIILLLTLIILNNLSIWKIQNSILQDENMNNLPSYTFYPVNSNETFIKEYKCNTEHQFSVKILNRDPFIMYIKNFLAPGEAEHLKHIGYPLMERSPVVNPYTKYHKARTSYSAFLNKSHDAVVKCIENRASYISQIPVENIEPLQVVRYREGQEYKPHFDWFSDNVDNGENEILERDGQRIITLFVYLNSVPEEKGGSTAFPELDLKVPANKNDAVFWYDTDVFGKGDERTLHAGSPVYGAEKWGLNIWIRNKKIEN